MRILIIGAGFAGLAAARHLSSFNVEILLINRKNYHLFSPLLHQVATAELEPELIAYPIRKILHKLPNVQFLTTEVTRIDLASQFVETANGLITYDFLVIATGSTPKFFGVSGAAEYAFPLKTIEQAVYLRNHILHCFELAAQEPNESRRRQLLTFVVVGGGFTGVELTGGLAELIYGSLVRDYPSLDFREVRLMLLHSGQILLPKMPKRLGIYAKAQLQKMGVAVILRTQASKVTPEALHLNNQRVIPTSTVIWTAGVRGNSGGEVWGLPTLDNGQVPVLPTLQLAAYPQVYVIGDLASLRQDGVALPMLAQTAIQQGKAAAINIFRQIQGKNPLPMRYCHLGTMAILGRNAAVVDLGKIKLTGFAAWLLWLGVHWILLPGFRNRLVVLTNWIWNYFLSDRLVRLILPLEAKAVSVANKDNKNKISTI